MKPHESPRIEEKSIRGDSGDSWPVWNRGTTKQDSSKEIKRECINSKTCFKRPLKKKTKLFFKTGDHLMQVKIIAEWCNTFHLH